MTKKEAIRQTHQENTLLQLGFTREEAEALRRISLTLHRWHEHECNGNIQRDGDDGDGKPYWHWNQDRQRYPIADRETGARKRLDKIVADRNVRVSATCPNCEQWQHAGDCLNECVKRGLAPRRKIAQVAVSAYIQGDPRGAALYIIRPEDVPAGKDVESYYTRGICVY